MPYATQWNTPRPARPSGSIMVSAKLLVPSGTPFHDSCGDTLSPTQFGFAGFLLATFFGISVPSLKVSDVSVNGSAAFAMPLTSHASTRAVVAAINALPDLLPCSSRRIPGQSEQFEHDKR